MALHLVLTSQNCVTSGSLLKTSGTLRGHHCCCKEKKETLFASICFLNCGLHLFHRVQCFPTFAPPSTSSISLGVEEVMLSSFSTHVGNIYLLGERPPSLARLDLLDSQYSNFKKENKMLLRILRTYLDSLYCDNPYDGFLNHFVTCTMKIKAVLGVYVLIIL